jgi:ribA/ribD-fused uncharacterized protein
MSEFTFFWKENDKNGFLSQWYYSPFQDDENIIYNCSEQYMMYHKAKLFNDDLIADRILHTGIPYEQKKLGRKIKNFNQKIWDEQCDNIVFTGNLLKFSQNPKLKEMLLNTKDTILVEASPYDNIWGIGLTESDKRASNPNKWLGKNKLGKILINVRNFIKKD